MRTLQAQPTAIPGQYVAQRRRSMLPSAATLSYVKDALEVFVLLIALPWLVRELIHDPAGLSARMAGHHALK